jgi:alanyl-tRNA synthetase
VQFKDVFLGKDERPYQRAVSSQRCVRAGGKHNDLERVGYTARHHTFFEMLGNFSFGDYFKREAIQFAWKFLTEELHIPAEKLWVTVYKDDKEAAAIWLNELNIDSKRFSYLGEDSNFWSMGPTGPCGPCTEIFYDHGADIPGGPPGSVDEDGDRYIEVWNLVFMQYDRSADGVMTPLPKPSVDTGLGFERITAVMQGVHNNYDIDLFQGLIKAIAALTGTQDLKHTSLRVIADHIRSSTFLITDGITPSNEGRGYVLRRIIRRALRHGNKLGLTEPFFYKLVAPLAEQMGDAYPELTKLQTHIEKVLRTEEEQFAVTLSSGLKLLEQTVKDLSDKTIPGEVAFKLYDTYGFPIDLTADIARERELTIDMDGFETAMNQQRERSRQFSKFTANYHVGAHLEHPTEFVGYEALKDQATIIALYHGDNAVDVLNTGEQGAIIVNKTPFYAESGGQVGDQGMLRTGNGHLFRVNDTQKQGQAFAHLGTLEKGQLKIGDIVFAEVDQEKRAAAVLNHTATHLLHMVLRQVLGEHVTQKGSLVEPDRLRFDFAHTTAISSDELKIIEKKVNDEIRKNHEAKVQISSPEEAIKNGAMALFEEKYGDKVRVVRFGDSVELCGGTHAHHTGDIGIFKITSESGVASGIRRLEAVTGEGALRWLDNRDISFKQKLQQSDEKIRTLEKQLEQLKAKLATSMGQDLLSQARSIGSVKILAAKLDDIDPKALRDTVDQLKNKLGCAVIALAVVKDGKVSIITGVTKDQMGKIKAGDLVNMIAQQVGGKGGGRPDLAEGGGNQPENLEKALDSVYEWVEKNL